MSCRIVAQHRMSCELSDLKATALMLCCLSAHLLTAKGGSTLSGKDFLEGFEHLFDPEQSSFSLDQSGNMAANNQMIRQQNGAIWEGSNMVLQMMIRSWVALA